MKTLALAAARAAALLLAATAAEAAPPPALQGTWVAVAAERDGAPAPDLVGHRLSLGEGRFRIEAAGQTLFGGTYAAEAGTAPGGPIDFRQDEGATLRGAWKGLYRLDGDRLEIVDNAADMTKPRPGAFATAPGSGAVRLTFRRE